MISTDVMSPWCPAITPDSRLILVSDRFGMGAALLVGRMLGLRNINALEREEGGALREWESGSYRDADGQVWRELGMAGLVYNSDFLQAGL